MKLEEKDKVNNFIKKFVDKKQILCKHKKKTREKSCGEHC